MVIAIITMEVKLVGIGRAMEAIVFFIMIRMVMISTQQ